MGISDIIILLGGIALFLFGMELMGDGLKRVAGNKLELILWRLSNTPIKGVLLGTGVTAVIQSSSATTVMVVGFVNSGMMTVYQAIGVIMGANIGTSVTGWILCLSAIGGGANTWISLLSTATLSAAVALIGILIRMFCKTQTMRHFGDILLGFAVLMYGMQAMSGSVEPLRSSPEFIKIITMFENPAIGIIAGVMITAILQSASASVGILQALALTGTISFATAIPIIMGMGIGASVPVLLSAIGANRDGKRTSLIYLFINIFGTVIWSVLFYGANMIIKFGFMSSAAGTVEIAFINSIYRIAMVFALFPFIKLLEKLSRIIIKTGDDEREKVDLIHNLEDRFIAHPALAVEQSRITMCDMAERVEANLYHAISLIDKYKSEEFDAIHEAEEIIDTYEDKLGTYLVRITGRELDNEQNRSVSRFLHTIGDFERIGDHAVNISEEADEISKKSIKFTDEALREISRISAAVSEIVSVSFCSFCQDNIELAYRVEPLEELIDILCDKAKLSHIERIRTGECTLEHGFVYNDLITDFERIADHCSNIGVAMIELEADLFDTHEYLANLKNVKTDAFNKYFEEYKDKYGF